MSVFKTKGIVLQIHKPKDKDFLYGIFTHDFGKLLVTKKKNTKEKSLDLGYLINCEIRTKEGQDIHKVSNIKILSEFNYKEKSFNLIQNYLELLALILEKSPDGVAHYEVFSILEKINTQKNINNIKLTLTKLKILNCFGELSVSHDNHTVQKILKFIDNSNIDDVLKLTGIDEMIEKYLQNIINS